MAARAPAGDAACVTRMRRIAVWLVVGLLIFMLVATLMLDATA
jgi:uncharacterized integral membrane protein